MQPLHLLLVLVSFLTCDYWQKGGGGGGGCVVFRFIRNDLNYIPETKSRKTLYKCIYSEYFLLRVLVLYRFLNSREGTGFFHHVFMQHMSE